MDASGDTIVRAVATTENVPPPVLQVPQERELHREIFLQTRRSLGVSELRAELTRLREQVEATRDAAFEERFARHEFEVEFPGDPPRVPAAPGPGGRPPLTETRTRVDPETEQISAWVATLPFDEYPGLYEHMDEIDWLVELVGE